jgi:2-polyprenyl-3-methyl-5-hydroxy-6-metoxy-1,4-benzoquinol methylase
MIFQNCLICNSSFLKSYFRLNTNGLVALKCRECGHVFIKNSPITSDNIADFYTLDDYKGRRKLQNKEWYRGYYDDCFADYKLKVGSSLILKQFQEKADYLDLSFPSKGRLLDIGCATGIFLDMMRQRSWDVEGAEISEDLAAYARKAFSLVVHEKDITKEKLISEPFDVITLFDVIEHIPNPNQMLAACKDLLVKDGAILIRTPTEEGLLRDIAKLIYLSSFKNIEYPMLWFYSFEHLHSFSLVTLTSLLNKHGFSVMKVFREEESLERINISRYLKAVMKGMAVLSSLANKQHKITVIARTN